MAFLKVTKGSATGQMIPLLSDGTILGRHPSSQIVLDDGAVSRHHAQVVIESGTFFIEDLRSRNGTEVNGVRISAKTVLNDGDAIRICDHLFQFLTHIDREPLPVPKKVFIGNNSAHPGSGTIDDQDDEEEAKPTGPQQVVPGKQPAEGSSVLSALEASSTGRGLRLNVRPEVKLRAILEISSALARVLDLEQVLSVILKSLFKIFNQADAGFVLLKDPETNRLKVHASHCLAANDDEDIPISMTVVRQAMDQTQAILSADVMGDRRFRSSESLTDLRLRSLMCAPLLGTDGSALGVIQLSTFEASNPFTYDDLDLIVNVTAQAALAVEYATLHATIIRQREVERDMAFAAQVQQGFLPSVSPQIPGFRFADYYKSAFDVGGDYFDYVKLPDGRLAMAIGDVAGKGVSAALLMARLHASARYHLLSATSAALAMTELNAEISNSGFGFRLITLVFAIVDPKSKTVCIANAGHLPPLHRAVDGRVTPIGMQTSGLPLGVLPEQNFNEMTLSLAPGESLVFYTDGITEAMNAQEEMFGKTRLQNSIASSTGEIELMVNELIGTVEAFCDSSSQRDDICVTAVQCIS